MSASNDTGESDSGDLMFIMNVKRKDGSADRVVVKSSDDPYKLATDFAEKYNLSLTVIAKLANKIDEQRRLFLLGVLEKSASTKLQPQKPVPNTPTYDDARGIPDEKGVVEQFLNQFEGENVESAPLQRAPETNGYTNAQESEDAFNRARDLWRRTTEASQVQNHVDHTNQIGFEAVTSPNFYIASPASRSRPYSDSKQQEDGASSIFQRLYGAAARHNKKQEQLKKKAEDDEFQKIEKTRFRLPENSPFSPQNFEYRLTTSFDGSNFGEQLYAKDMKWREDNKKRTEMKRKKRDEQVKSEEKTLLTFKPVLSPHPTSLDKTSRDVSQSVHVHLYEDSLTQKKKMSDLKNSYAKHFVEEYPFQPQMDHANEELAAHGRQRRLAEWQEFNDFLNKTQPVSPPASISSRNPQTPSSNTSDGSKKIKRTPSLSTPEERRAEMLAEDSRRVAELIQEQQQKSALKLQQEISTPLSSDQAIEASIDGNDIAADAKDKTENGSVSLLSQKEKKRFDIFENLYQEYFYRSANAVRREKTAVRFFPHKPNIGLSTFIPVEKKKADFFDRLYRHDDPDIGMSRGRRSSSVDGRKKATTGVQQLYGRSRSVSREFTTSRRQALTEEAKRTTALSRNASPKNISPRQPFGYYSTKENSSSRPKEPVFHNFVFSDSNDTLSMNGTPGRCLQSIGASNISLSRKEQLQELADKKFHETCSQSSRKLSEHQARILLSRMELDIQKRKMYADNELKRTEDASKVLAVSKTFAPKSSLMVGSIKRRALSDIFDVLLVSVHFAKSQRLQSDDSDVNQEDKSSVEDISSRGLLDTALAIPSMLKPKELVDVIGVILAKYSPRPMSRDTFIAVASDAVSSSKCPPLNFILSKPYSNGSRARSSGAYRTPAEREADMLQDGLPLNRLSRDVSEHYLRGRKDFMQDSNISHSDLIYAYDEIYRKKLIDKREEILRKERSIYTFTPSFSTRPDAHQFWSKKISKRSKSTNLKPKDQSDNFKGNTVQRTSKRNGPDEPWRLEVTQASSITNGSDVRSQNSIKSYDIDDRSRVNSGISRNHDSLASPPSYSAAYQVKLQRRSFGFDNVLAS